MTGLLGLIGWKVTVISSNFIALMLILTMAMNIHISTRFLQLKKINPILKNSEIIFMTTGKMFWPIIYTALTTICAFLSLIFSEIKPVIDFGWMMSLGLITSFLITFTLLPTLINLLSTEKINIEGESKSKITEFLGEISINSRPTIFLITLVVIISSIVGISRLAVSYTHLRAHET